MAYEVAGHQFPIGLSPPRELGDAVARGDLADGPGIYVAVRRRGQHLATMEWQLVGCGEDDRVVVAHIAARAWPAFTAVAVRLEADAARRARILRDLRQVIEGRRLRESP